MLIIPIIIYETKTKTPQIEIINLELEQAILTGSNPTVTNPDMGWDD